MKAKDLQGTKIRAEKTVAPSPNICRELARALAVQLHPQNYFVGMKVRGYEENGIRLKHLYFLHGFW